MDAHKEVAGLNRGAYSPPGSLAVLATLPGVMRITKYCHGEIKVSLTAGTRAAGNRATQLQLLRARAHDPSVVMDAKKRVWERDMHQMSARSGGGYGALFNSTEKFLDGNECISGYGRLPRRRKFSARARRSICEGATVAHERFGMNGVFLTWTIPGSGELIEKTVASWSGHIMESVLNWVRANVPGERAVFGVWEHQERGMLHLHLCVMADDYAALQFLIDDCKRFWAGLLTRLRIRTGVNLCESDKNCSWLPDGPASQQYGAWLHKGVAQYLAKYTGKGYRTEAMRSKYHPSRWWTQSRWLAQEARRRRMKLIWDGCTAHELLAQLKRLNEGVEEIANKTVEFINGGMLQIPGFIAMCDDGQADSVLSVMCAQMEVDGYQSWRVEWMPAC